MDINGRHFIYIVQDIGPCEMNAYLEPCARKDDNGYWRDE